MAPAVQQFALKLVLGTHPELPDSPAAARAYLRFGASPRAAQAIFVATAQQVANEQPLRRRRGFVTEQFGERTIERASDLPEHEDRGIAHAKFEVRQMSFRNLGDCGQRLARQPLAGAQQSNPFTEGLQERVAQRTSIDGMQRLVDRFGHPLAPRVTLRAECHSMRIRSGFGEVPLHAP